MTPDKVRITGRRLEHVTTVHRASVGGQLRVGRIGGLLGTGTITRLDGDVVEMEVLLNEPPPAPLSLTLYLALPRPKFMKRVLHAATNLGVKKIYLFNSYRVDKIYWSSAQLTEAFMREACLLGLEQARDTVLPEIHLRRLFKPFVEDELPGLVKEGRALVAHPTAVDECPRGLQGPIHLAIGPEGGFIDYEIDKLRDVAGFQPVHTLERILKVETAVTSLIGRLC
jgi:RsmE family RNA methyltransferase